MALERALEDRCCVLARQQGCYPIKLGGFAVGLPDRVFLLPAGKVWLVEFKSPTGPLGKRQRYEFEQLRVLGHPVSVIRDYPRFCHELFERLEQPLPAQLRLDLT